MPIRFKAELHASEQKILHSVRYLRINEKPIRVKSRYNTHVYMYKCLIGTMPILVKPEAQAV